LIEGKAAALIFGGLATLGVIAGTAELAGPQHSDLLLVVTLAAALLVARRNDGNATR
jgi:hypothetical protein